MGEESAGTTFFCSHARCVALTSPLPPSRIARIVGLPNPETEKTIPSPTTSDGTTPSPSLRPLQIRSPVSRSNPCTTSPAPLSNCGFPSTSATTGETWAIRDRPRLPRQRSLPVLVSSASTNDRSHGFCQPSSLSLPSLLQSKGTISRCF